MAFGIISDIHGNYEALTAVRADPDRMGIDEYLEFPEAEYFSRVIGQTFMSGHTHVQAVHHFGDKVYCNPGSVGQPRDGDPRSAFAVYDGEFTLHRVEYDMQVVFDLMEAAG